MGILDWLFGRQWEKHGWMATREVDASTGRCGYRMVCAVCGRMGPIGEMDTCEAALLAERDGWLVEAASDPAVAYCPKHRGAVRISHAAYFTS